jgi:hypothetical protein
MGLPDPASALNHDDLLSLGIGRVIRSHSLLEYRLRNVYQVLAAYGTDSDVAGGPPGAERLVDSCRRRLKRAELDPSLTAAGSRALEAARKANALRNGIVHDLWLLDPRKDADQSPRWNRLGAKRGQSPTMTRTAPGDLDTVEEARLALDRAGVRISGLFMALHEVLPSRHVSAPTQRGASSLPTYVALMEDQFHLEANGVWEVSAPT